MIPSMVQKRQLPRITVPPVRRLPEDGGTPPETLYQMAMRGLQASNNAPPVVVARSDDAPNWGSVLGSAIANVGGGLVARHFDNSGLKPPKVTDVTSRGLHSLDPSIPDYGLPRFGMGGMLRRVGDAAIVGDGGEELAVKIKQGTQIIPLPAIRPPALDPALVPPAQHPAMMEPPQRPPSRLTEALTALQSVAMGQPPAPPMRLPTYNPPTVDARATRPRSVEALPRIVQRDQPIPELSAQPSTDFTPRAMQLLPPPTLAERVGYDVNQPVYPDADQLSGGAGYERRPRVVDPVGYRTKRIEDMSMETPHDHNGRLKSVLIGAGRGALQGLIHGGIGGALGGAAAGGVLHAADPSSDERYALRDDMAHEQAALDRTLSTRSEVAKVRTAEASADYMANVRPEVARGGLEVKRDAAAAKRVRDEQNSVLSILRLRKGQAINPARADDAALLDRARRAGVTVDPDAWNSSSSNLVPVEIVDSENPTQKRRQFYNKATGEISDVGQSGYVAPVHSDTELTSNQEGVNADRDASRELAKQRVGIAAGNAQLANDKFMWEVTNGIPASAKRSFDVQTQPLQKELTSKLAEIKSWQQRAAANAVMPDEAERHIAEIQTRVGELQTQIGAARDKALAPSRPALRVPPARRAPAPAGGYTEAQVRERAARMGRDADAAVAAARAAGLIR